MTWARWIWRFLFVSLGLYASLPVVLALDPPEQSGTWGTLTGVFAAISLVLGLLSVSIHRAVVTRLLGANPEFRNDTVAQARYIRSAIAAWTLAEIPAMLGSGLFLITRRPELLYAFLGWTALLLLVLRPPEIPTTTRSSADLARSDIEIG